MIAAIIALTAAISSSAPIDPAAKGAFAQDRYRFCHEADYPLLREEHAWCPLIGDVSDACPTLPKACKAPPVDHLGSTSRDGHGSSWGRRGRAGARGARGHGGPDSKGQPDGKVLPGEDSRTRAHDFSFSFPGMSVLAQVFFVLLLVAFVVVVGRAVAQNLLRRRLEDPVAEDAPQQGVTTPATSPRGPIETDVERLLARARASAAQGDYGRALDDAYAALLRRLDGDALIEIHPSRTNGDYTRMLRDRPDVAGPVRGIFRDVERVQFGASPPSERLFHSVLERVVPLVSRALSVAVIFLGLAAALSCTPHDAGSSGSNLRADTSPSGTAALVEVLEKHSYKVRYRSESVGNLDRPLTLVVLPDADIEAADWKRVLAWVHDQGGHLVLAGVNDAPDEVALVAVPDQECSPLLDVEGQALVVASPPGSCLVPRLGQETPEEQVSFARRGKSEVAIDREYGKGRILAFADPRLFTNISLVTADNAAFLLSVMGRVSPPAEVELCDEWTGAGASNPFESVHRAELTPVILQLLALLALMFIWKGVPFAKLRDPVGETRRSFADHVRALGLSYARARASRHVVGLYSVWALERLRERVHRAGRQGLIPLAEAIAARTGRGEAEVMAVLVDASSARDEAAPPSSFRTSVLRSRHARDEAEADLALIHALQGFLAATGQRPTGSREGSKPSEQAPPPAR